MIELSFLFNAIVFAAEKHQFQRRKGYLKIPYINHPLKVCKTLIDHGELDSDLLVASVLHDTLEDTQTTYKEIEDFFGTKVAKIVNEVTDDMSLPENIRKELQVEKAPKLSNSAKKIKIADKLCNITDLINYPIYWSKARKIRYIEWSGRVFSQCRGVNTSLEMSFIEMSEIGLKSLNK